jgi:uncharacterized protein YndB with AHSA1/START domain
VRIDAHAPVVGSAEREVATPPQLVWDVLTTIDEWPSWNPDLTEASLEGELREGSTFRWKAGAVKIASTLGQVEPPRTIAWTSKSRGLRAIHVYRLDPHRGGTLVTTEESWDGFVARLFRVRMHNTLATALDAGLVSIKAEAERRAAAA